MTSRRGAHSDTGLKRVLVRPRLYRLFGRLLGAPQAVRRLVRDYIKPFDGCRILDLGCGPADVLGSITPPIGEYHGLDVNPAYIEAARSRWRDRPECAFACEDVRSAAPIRPAHYDIVLAVAVVHHLDDRAAQHLFALAHEALSPGGRLITYDNVYVEGQHWLARWLITRDRGGAVRTVDGYRQLAAPHFTDVEGDVLHDTLNVPYTIHVMTCTKT